jgi:hypothetical protein
VPHLPGFERCRPGKICAISGSGTLSGIIITVSDLRHHTNAGVRDCGAWGARVHVFSTGIVGTVVFPVPRSCYFPVKPQFSMNYPIQAARAGIGSEKSRKPSKRIVLKPFPFYPVWLYFQPDRTGPVQSGYAGDNV